MRFSTGDVLVLFFTSLILPRTVIGVLGLSLVVAEEDGGVVTFAGALEGPGVWERPGMVG